MYLLYVAPHMSFVRELHRFHCIQRLSRVPMRQGRTSPIETGPFVTPLPSHGCGIAVAAASETGPR